MSPTDLRPRVKLVDLWLEMEENPLATMWAIDSEGRLWRRHRNEFGRLVGVGTGGDPARAK